MSGDVHVRFCEGLGVRFPRATRLLMGFRLESDARKVFDVLPKRVARFGLRLHPEKTKLSRYFRPARSSTNKRKDSGGATRETFDFLGFTHYWGRTRRRSWVIMLKTRTSTLQRKVRVAWEWCRAHRHLPVRGPTSKTQRQASRSLSVLRGPV